MLHEAIGTASSIEEATNIAVSELNAPENVDVQVEVLEMPVKKTFGLFGGSPAKVRAYYTETPSMVSVSFLKTMLDNMGIENYNIETEDIEDGLVINLECEDYGLIIGRRGETLDALQYLTGLAANKDSEEYFRITINTGNYREKREKTLAALAKKNAIQVTRTGVSITLEPMNPYERRIIHTAVQNVKGAESHSIGEDADRRVVISLEEGFKPTGKPKNNYKGKGGYKGKGRSFNKNDKSGGRPPYKGNGNNRGGKSGGKPQYNKNFNNKPKGETRPPKSDNDTAPMYGRIDK